MIHLGPFAFTAVVVFILSSLPMADAAPPDMRPSSLNLCVAVSAVAGAGIAVAVAIADSTTAAPEFIAEIPLPEAAPNIRAHTAPSMGPAENSFVQRPLSPTVDLPAVTILACVTPGER